MKATHEILESMPQNLDRFGDPFFNRFPLRPAPAPLKLSDKVSKTYQFPTFYSDVTCAIGIFMCDYDKARRALPDARMRPVRMPRGRALVAFSCYEYKNVMQVWPYNEISMMIPVLLEPKLDVPVLPMVASGLFSSMGYYVFHMPVTSKENQIRGNRFWGLPKVTEDIEITRQGGDCVTVARGTDGAPYFTLRVPMAGNPAHFDVSSNVYSVLDGKTLSSRTCFKADFAVTKHMNTLFKRGLKPDREYLTIGASPAARILRELDIEAHPFQFRFAQGMNACFDLAHSSRVSGAEGNA